MGSHIFVFLGVSSSYLRLEKVPGCLYCRLKVKCSSFGLKYWSVH